MFVELPLVTDRFPNTPVLLGYVYFVDRVKDPVS